MISILKAVRQLKDFVGKKRYVMIYGTGYKAVYCKNLMDNCHIITNYFMITGEKVICDNDKEKELDGVQIKKISDFPYTDDMSAENTAIVIATNEKYWDEIQTKLVQAGITNVYVFSQKFKLASVGITTRVGCSVACEYCPQELFVKKYNKMQTKEYGEDMVLTLECFKKYLEHIPKFVQIHFAGFAEPFLNPECSAMIQYAYEQGYYIETLTTLVGVTEEIIDEIFHKTRFVLHLPDEENKTNIKIDENYIKCLTHIFELNKREKRILRISAPMPVSSKLLPYIPDDVIVQGELNDRGGNVDVEGIRGWSLSGSVTCERTQLRLDRNVMLPNGDILLCCQDWGLKNILGNLKEQTWTDILDGKTANRIREDMKNGDKKLVCHSCNFAIELMD